MISQNMLILEKSVIGSMGLCFTLFSFFLEKRNEDILEMDVDCGMRFSCLVFPRPSQNFQTVSLY